MQSTSPSFIKGRDEGGGGGGGAGGLHSKFCPKKAKKILIFLLNRFAMLHIFYKQLKSGDITELSMTLTEFPF